MTSPREWIATAALCLLATAVLAQTTASAPAGKLQVKDADLLAKFARSPLLLTGKIAGAQMGPAAMSDPPIYSVSLTLENVEMLRGADPKAKAYSYQARQPNPPVFEIGSTVIVAAMDYAGRIVVNQIVPATADALADAKLAACLPAGWAVEGGKLVSPWAELARKDWPPVRSAISSSVFISRSAWIWA